MRFFLSILMLLAFAPELRAQEEEAKTPAPVQIGWLGAMSGPLAKYGAHQSALLALEDINASGGINHRPLELIFEDSKGDSREAVSAARKLILQDRVKYIIGGHSSPESIPIAPIAEKHGVVMLAAITSSPKLSNAGKYVFRLSPDNTKVADILLPYALDTLGLKRFAIIHAETDYARPVAERLYALLKERGIRVVEFTSYNRGETDFRALIVRIRAKKPDALFLGAQAPDTAVLILEQMKELGLVVKQVFGNETTGNARLTAGAKRHLFEGLVYVEPRFDLNKPKTRAFVERFKRAYGVDSLSYGIWTAEAYDAVMVLAKIIEKCGEHAEQVRKCLSGLKRYSGVSGTLGIDKNHNGAREYVLKRIEGNRALVKK